MRRLITLLLISMMIFPLLAEEKKIELQRKAHDIERRSMAYAPTVTHDDNAIYIYSNTSLENLQVIITNLSTKASFNFGNISIWKEQPYILYLNSMESGNYKIEIAIKSNNFYGYFDIVNNGIE